MSVSCLLNRRMRLRWAGLAYREEEAAAVRQHREGFGTIGGPGAGVDEPADEAGLVALGQPGEPDGLRQPRPAPGGGDGEQATVRGQAGRKESGQASGRESGRRYGDRRGGRGTVTKQLT